MHLIKIFIILFVYSLGCLGAGALVLSLLSGDKSKTWQTDPPTALATQFLLGMGVLANLWLLMAMAGWFTPLALIIFMAAVLIGGLFCIKPQIKGLSEYLRLWWPEFRGQSWYWHLIVCLTWLLALGGISRTGFTLLGDGTAIYYTLPKVIAASHRFVPLPGLAETFSVRIGLLGELHYAALMSLGLADDARLFDWVAIMAGAIMLCGICSRAGIGKKGQRLALAMMFTSTAVLYLMCEGKVDLFAAAMALAAVYWALCLDILASAAAVRLTGLFTGLALVAKLSYAISFLPVIVVLALWRLVRVPDAAEDEQNKNAGFVRRGLTTLFCLGFWALLPLLPHIAKMAIWLGNPLTQAVLTSARHDIARFSPSDSLRILATYPLALVFGKYPGQYGNLSPLILAFAPLILLLPKPKTLRAFFSGKLTMVTGAALIGMLSWIILRPTGLQIRLFLATGLLFIPLAARGAEAAFKIKPKAHLLKAGVIMSTVFAFLAVGSILYERVFFPYEAVLHLTGQMPMCQRDGDFCRAAAAINEKAPKEGRVLFLAFHSYWLRPDLLQCISRAKDVIFWDSNPKIDALWTHICRQGFSYILIDKNLRPSYLNKIEHRPPWVKIKTIYDQNFLVVYQLDFVAPPVKPEVKCRQVDPPAWDLVHP